MSTSDGPTRSNNPLSALLRLLRLPWGRPRSEPADVRPTDPAELGREVRRVQAGIIRDAFKGEVATAGPENSPVKDDADLTYLYRPGHLLVQAERLDEVLTWFRERGEDFGGEPEPVEEPIKGRLVTIRLPSRRDRADDVLATLDELDDHFGRQDDADSPPVATPDHIMYVTTRGGLCPATEPEVPRSRTPWPPQEADPTPAPDPKDKIRVAVVDTGLWMEAIDSDASPWLESDDVFADATDEERVDRTAIHPYAGHGTFVAGVISCLAPETRIEVEGLLTRGGAIWESRIVRQLDEALGDDNHPQLVSISAGTHTRCGRPPLSFAMLAAEHRLAERDDVLVIAAAGNDASDEKFWPAAFSWAVSVGSVDPDRKVSDFSNYGKDWVKIYARGRDLVNAFPVGAYTCHEPPHAGIVRKFDGLAQWSGTSFSTPIVTGLVAAVMRDKRIPARAAWQAVEATAIDEHDTRINEDIRIVGPLT
ncbi:S8/S53 family peptidase [Nocardioides albidus]|uniref:S8/S53 family peptidase n=1 Tax=Nocardioides albidus TaxID=1517589 RepID=A0A5C4VRV5_9ACTN|nr:S8/S53 family peptidase [Nocardioides albidus]TNM38593.1 S8/S53 family peptidase [Nocardioides albidus]